jgi:hypothetical protein
VWTKFPERVWDQTRSGQLWSSREADPEDAALRKLVAASITSPTKELRDKASVVLKSFRELLKAA